MNSDLFFHLLPRLSKDSLVYLYTQDSNILTETNLDVLMDYYKNKVCNMNTRRLVSLIRLSIKYNRLEFVSEVLNNLPEYKKVNLFFAYKKQYELIDFPVLQNYENEKCVKVEDRRLEFVLYNLKLK